MELSDKAREAKRQYKRDWNRKNREHVKEKQREYREKHREWYRKYMREWKRNNPEKVKKQNQNYWERKALEMSNDNVSVHNKPVTKDYNSTLEKVCQECGTKISGKKKFCSQRCKQRAYRKKNKK